MTFSFWLSLIACLLTVAVTAEIAWGMRRMTLLTAVAPAQDTTLPRVSIVIPACNEAETIEPALHSVLALDYPDLEIIVVNDRSTDHTQAVLARMQQRHPRIRLHAVRSLPAGWLGKSHALQSGAELATGAYLLFTDADIIMERSTLRRAINHMQGKGLDHLCLIFENIAPGGLLNGLLLEVCGGLLLLFKPWLAKDEKSKRFMGVGAFNLVRADCYRAIDGHRSFALHPIDDVMLGKVLKQKGFRQECLLGYGLVQVRWYGTIGALVDGLGKNTFAVYDFNLLAVLAGCLLIVLMNIVPTWGLLFATGLPRLLFGIAVAARVLSFAHGFSYTGFSRFNALWALLTPYCNLYLVLRAVILNLRHDGISWRGTRYPLAALRKQPSLYR